MQGYRLYFLNGDHAITAKDEFVAADDVLANLVAEQLFDACSDEYASYEIWHGARLVRRSLLNGGAPRVTQEMRNEAQEIVLDRERVLLESRWRVARSKKLIEATLTLEESLRPQRRRN